MGPDVSPALQYKPQRFLRIPPRVPRRHLQDHLTVGQLGCLAGKEKLFGPVLRSGPRFSGVPSCPPRGGVRAGRTGVLVLPPLSTCRVSWKYWRTHLWKRGCRGLQRKVHFLPPAPPILLQRQLVGPEFFAITPKVHVRVFVRKEAVLSKVTETKGKTNPPSAFLQH